MSQEKSKLQQRIESGKTIVIAEISPPLTPEAAKVKALVKNFTGKIHALGVSDNREGVRMSALAASSIALSEGIEPILHMATRDRNRAALVSDFLGAQALGIRNFLGTSGEHQSLSTFLTAKNVYDIDSTLLLQSFKNLEKDASIVGEHSIHCAEKSCLGAVASPYADPMELQLPRLAQKIFVGAQFLVTQPVFDLDRFGLWWKEVVARGLHKKAAFIAGIKILTDGPQTRSYSEKRPFPMIPETLIKRMESKSDAAAARAEGIKIALETIQKLSSIDGLRGFEIMCDDDSAAAAEILDSLKSKIG